jgi:hypothetical protein
MSFAIWFTQCGRVLIHTSHFYESDTAALCKSNGERHILKPLAARHGRGTACYVWIGLYWETHYVQCARPGFHLSLTKSEHACFLVVKCNESRWLLNHARVAVIVGFGLYYNNFFRHDHSSYRNELQYPRLHTLRDTRHDFDMWLFVGLSRSETLSIQFR